MALLRDEPGLRAQVARGLGLTRAAVFKWTEIPAHRLVDVERITGIPRDQLRPDLFKGYCCHRAAA